VNKSCVRSFVTGVLAETESGAVVMRILSRRASDSDVAAIKFLKNQRNPSNACRSVEIVATEQ
jgi:uncharacterized protein YcfJ